MVFTFQPPVWAGLSGYVAEMTGAFVCASLGITPTVRHADYIGSWLAVMREDSRAIVRAASAASRAADYLLAFRPEAVSGAAANDDGDGPDDPAAMALSEGATLSIAAAMHGIVISGECAA